MYGDARDRVPSPIRALIEGGRRGVELPARRRRHANAMVAGKSRARIGGYRPITKDFLDVPDIKKKVRDDLSKVFGTRYLI
jgi:hypothetical protein